VKFKKSVEETPDLKGSWRPGLQALLGADKDHVTAEDTHSITGSVNLDATLKEKFPNDNRWDYAIGHQPSNVKGVMVYWTEIHPASSGEVKVVLAKLDWLQRWLKDSAPKLRAMRRAFVWISSGRTSFTLSSPKQKRFASLGLRRVGSVFRIPNKAFS
jgi:hypothetical protein